MMNLSLAYPMFTMVLLTAIVLLLMFRARVVAVQKGKIDGRYFKTFADGYTPPEDVVKTQRHFINLFEAPVLFYAGCIVAMIVPIHGLTIQIWAWAYVLCRVVHCAIHLGSNKLYPRMAVYGVGWIALLGLWITVVWKIANPL